MAGAVPIKWFILAAPSGSTRSVSVSRSSTYAPRAIEIVCPFFLEIVTHQTSVAENT
ncbi:MAG: hypothetical protein ACFB2X_10645 [Rivularia sp. (in: cyanobacteria)]